MKIAICVNGRPHEGGVTTFINSVVDPLRELGHRVDVITIFGVSKYREVRPDLVKKSDAFLKGSNFRTYLAYKISEVMLFFHLYRGYLKHRYDVIYAIDVSAANLALIIRNLHQIKVFLRVGSSVVKDLLCQEKITEGSFVVDFLKRQESQAYSRVDGIIPNGTWSRDYVLSICPKAKVLGIVYSPVPEKIFGCKRTRNLTVRQRLNVQSDDSVILFSARLVKRKGPMVALYALENLLKIDAKFKLIYIGIGPEGQKIIGYVNTKKLNACVRMLGGVPHNEIGKYYAVSDVVVIPSVTHKGYEEPLASSCLEGIAAGVPVIASAIGGLKDFIKDRVNGLLVPQNDPQELARAILMVRNNDNLRQTLIKNGLKTIRRNNHPVSVARVLGKYFLDRSRK